MYASSTRLMVTALVAALALGGLACGKDKKKRRPKSKTPPAGEKQATPPAGGDKTATPPAGEGAGTIKGVVKFTGDAPEMPTLDRKSDPVCAKTEAKAEVVVVNDNSTLRNVVVRIKPGTVKGPAPTDAIKVDQKDCVFRPRVQGAMSDQEITVTNQDPTTHNLHGFSLAEGGGEESLFNLAQPKGAPEITKDANGYEVIRMKCDVHPWMVAYIVVTDHPYFAVTGDDGSFTLEGVPAGKYTLEAWHEHYGVKTAEVTVADKGTAEAEFTFDAGEKPL